MGTSLVASVSLVAALTAVAYQIASTITSRKNSKVASQQLAVAEEDSHINKIRYMQEEITNLSKRVAELETKIQTRDIQIISLEAQKVKALSRVGDLEMENAALKLRVIKLETQSCAVSECSMRVAVNADTSST